MMMLIGLARVQNVHRVGQVVSPGNRIYVYIDALFMQMSGWAIYLFATNDMPPLPTQLTIICCVLEFMSMMSSDTIEACSLRAFQVGQHRQEHALGKGGTGPGRLQCSLECGFMSFK